MTSLQSGYRAYLLRLWHTAEATDGWRASLEDPHTGERRAFASLSELSAFLAEEATVAHDVGSGQAQKTSASVNARSSQLSSAPVDIPDKKGRAT